MNIAATCNGLYQIALSGQVVDDYTSLTGLLPTNVEVRSRSFGDVRISATSKISTTCHRRFLTTAIAVGDEHYVNVWNRDRIIVSAERKHVRVSYGWYGKSETAATEWKITEGDPFDLTILLEGIEGRGGLLENIPHFVPEETCEMSEALPKF